MFWALAFFCEDGICCLKEKNNLKTRELSMREKQTTLKLGKVETASAKIGIVERNKNTDVLTNRY